MSDILTVPGGIKVFFEEGTTGTKGFRDLGNLSKTSMQSAIQTLEHYTSRSGQRLLDKKAVQQSSISIKCSFDEPNAYNMRWAFLGGDMSAVNAGAVAVHRELLQLNGSTAATLALAINVVPGVTVHKIDGSPTTYSSTTDYLLTGNTLSRRVSSAIADGEFVMVDYNAQVPAHKSFPVLESPILSGAARLLIQPTTGARLWWEIPSVQLAPDGTFNLDDQNWMTADMLLTVLADTTNNPSAPYGTVRTWAV